MSPNQNFNSGNIIMLSAQQQQQQYQIVANSLSANHRSKVIVANTNNNNNNNISNNNNNNNNNNNSNHINNNNNNNELKMQSNQQQQQQTLTTAQQKRKAYSTTTPYAGVHHNQQQQQQPASVARRNARERNRVKLVNDGFATLREHIPQSIASQVLGSSGSSNSGGNGISTNNQQSTSSSRANSKKLSKVETLRLAVQYIRSLKNLIDEHDNDGLSQSSESAPSPISSQGVDGLSDADPQSEPIDVVQFEFKSESDEDTYRQTAYHQAYNHHHHHPHHPHHHQQFVPQHRQSPIYAPTPCSEASCSPTPSFASDASSTCGSQGNGSVVGGGFSGNVLLTTTATTLPDNYYEGMSQEDEEIFDFQSDYISLWNQ